MNTCSMMYQLNSFLNTKFYNDEPPISSNKTGKQTQDEKGHYCIDFVESMARLM